MAITTRETTATGVTNKGAPLTNAEVDANFIELQQDKIELTDLSVTTNSAGTAALTYTNTTGVFTYTPPDLSSYLTSETNDLTASVTWANVPDANITESSVTQHEAALTVTSTQVSDFGEAVDDQVNTLLQAGLGIDLDYDDVSGELTIDSNHVEVNCTNNSGASIAIGTPVYQTGVSGNNITIAPADADDAAKMPAIGLTTATIANGASGTVVILGVVNGLDTSSFTAGDTVYVSTTAGALTTTAPSGESGLIQNFGRVLKVNASAGSIAVMGAGRANAVPNLNDGNVFIGNASNQAETRALVEADISDFGTYLTAESDTLDSVTGRGNTTSNSITVGDATVTGDLTVQGTTTTLNTATLDVEDKNITINYSTGDSSGSADGAGITIQDAVNSTTDATILWDATGDKFEFSHAVDVTGNITVSGTVDGRDIATDGTKLDGIEASADVTDATNVAAAGAVMDGDFTANGFMKRTGAGTYTVDTSTYLTSYTETDTLDSVTGRGNTTFNDVTVGNFTSTGIDDNATSTAITIDSGNHVSTAKNITAGGNLVVGSDGSVTGSEGGQIDIRGDDGTTTQMYLDVAGSASRIFTVSDNVDFYIGQLVGTGGAVRLYTNATERARLDANGNLGIGTTNVDSGVKLHVQESDAGLVSQTGASVALFERAGNCGISIGCDGDGDTTVFFGDATNSTIGRVNYDHSNNQMSFWTNNNPRVYIDNTGNLLVGKTLNSATDDGLSLLPSGRVNIVNNNGGSAVIVQSFYNDSASAAGYISITGTATSYNTSSDQRLKENVVSLDGAVDRIKQLSVHRFNFIADPNITVDGFLAHEVAEVVPEAITGTKDEVDDEGNPVYQGIDQSKLVPLLTAALQEALTKIDDLETRLSALEAN